MEATHLATLKPQLQLLLFFFPGAHLTHFACRASQNCSQSLFNHCVKIIQRVSAFDSVSVCQTLPFPLCVVRCCISRGYPPQDSNNTTSWLKLRDLFVWFFLFFFPDASLSVHGLLSNLNGMIYWILSFCYLSLIFLLILNITDYLIRAYFRSESPLCFSFSLSFSLTHACAHTLICWENHHWQIYSAVVCGVANNLKYDLFSQIAAD